MKNTALTAENVFDFQTKINSLETKITELETLVEWYQNQLLNAKRKQFGASSEHVELSSQLSLFNEPEPPAPPPQTEEITYKRKKRKGKREEDLSGLPVERIDYELSEAERVCPDCGETMRDIGVEVRRELKLIPAKIVVVEHAAHSYACRKCETTGIKTPFAKAKAPAALIKGSLASPSLVSSIMSQKYVSGLPLYRIENGFRYDGVNITRQTMCNWGIKCSELYLEGLYELLKYHLLNETVLMSDETHHQVLREPGRAATSKSYEWVYRTGACANRKIVIYEYNETRQHEHAKRFLDGFQGLLHSDGYEAYHNLSPGITVVGCWSHLRRRYEAIWKNTAKDNRRGSNAETALAYINALFEIERELAVLTPEERYTRRLTDSKWIAEAFFDWASNLGAIPKSPMGEANKYAMNQREWLMNVFVDGRTELSNNRCERSVKPFVMGRRSWLFSNSPAGARASSVIYSIVETAKENGLHPQRYLEYLLEKLPSATSSELEALLPWSGSMPESIKVTDNKDNIN